MEQLVVPVRAHGFVGEQAASALQVAQTWSAEQYWLEPQLAPAGSQLSGTHTDEPVAQEVNDVEAQRLSAAQSAPAVQALQMPVPLQTWLGPQVTPGATGVVSTQTGVPVVQEVVPFMQGFVGVHAVPLAQGRHWPLAVQTAPTPQVVPGGRKPVSVQTGEPDPQAMVPPVEQGLPVEQVAPAVQAVQAPDDEQTWSVPQEVPGATYARSVQTAAPVEHS